MSRVQKDNVFITLPLIRFQTLDWRLVCLIAAKCFFHISINIFADALYVINSSFLHFHFLFNGCNLLLQNSKKACAHTLKLVSKMLWKVASMDCWWKKCYYGIMTADEVHLTLFIYTTQLLGFKNRNSLNV